MRCAPLAAIFAICLCLPCFGQLDRGTITGTVTDPTGAAIVAAKVTVLNTATGAKLDTVTNNSGQYTAVNLVAGNYEVMLDAAGFKRSVRSGIVLQVSDVLRVDGRLELGSTAESVEVTAAVSQLQTESPEVSTAINNKALLALPLSFAGGRHAENFAFSTAPGVQGSGFTSHINGSTGFSKETLVDGATVTVNQSGDATAGYVSLEALQEVKIQTSGLSAEFGRTQGGVFNYIMKSGANQIHGSAFGALRNEALNANSFANNFRGVARPLDRKQNYAFSFGGPVVIPKLYNGHNKTFFYSSYERYHESTFSLGAPTLTSPVPEFYKGDFSRLLGPSIGADALNRPVYKGAIYDPATFRQLPGGRYAGDMFPGNVIPPSRFSQVSRNLNAIATAHYLPTVRDASGQVPLVNNEAFPISGQPIWDHYLWSLKADHNFTDNHRLSASMNFARTPRLILDANGLWDPTSPNGGPLARARTRGDTGELVRVGEDWTISPRLLNHVTLFYNRRGNPQIAAQSGVDGAKELGIKNLSTVGYPAVNWGGGPYVTLESPGFTSTSFRADVSFGASDTLSFSLGRHFLKAGVDIRFTDQNSNGGFSESFNFAARGTAIPNESFAGTQTGYSFASYLLGIVDSAGQNDPVPLGGRRHYYALFLQDDFKVSKNLTVNVGLRWEYQPPVIEVADRLSSWDPNKLDPLSGLRGAYAFAGKCGVCTGSRSFGSPDYKDFGPRIGFAWHPLTKWTFRGAYGILYEADSFNGYSPTPLGKPTNVQAGGTYSLNADPVNPWAGIFNWDNGFPSTSYAPPSYDVSWGDKNRPAIIDPNYGKSPYIQQWNFNIQRELFSGIVVDAGYLGVKGTRLKSGDLARINQLPVSALQQYGAKLNNAVRNSADAAANGIAYPYPGFVGTVGSALRPYPQVQGNNTVQDYGAPLGFSTYHSLQIVVTRRFRKGLDVSANYVFSKSISNDDSSLIGDNSGPLDYYNLKLEKSVTSYDIPHAFKAFVNYQLPVGRGRAFLSNAPRLVNAVLGGWNTSAILNYYSGTPLTFSATTPLSGGWNGALNRPNVAAGNLLAPNFDKSKFELSSTLSPNDTYLDKAAFSQPAPLMLGTAARRYTAVRGFGVINEDLALSKSNRLTEKFLLSIRAEFLNALNRHQLGGISTNVTAINFGQVTNVTGNRQIQVSARLDF
jgi:hypothetical protein